MSVQALGWTLDHSPTRGAERLVLIAIASHAGTSPVDGAWEAYPGIQTIQREAGLERKRTVQDALARLVASGAVERVINGAPDERVRKDQRTNLYRILLDHGVSCGVTRCRWCGVTDADTPYQDDGVTPGAQRGDAKRHDGVTPNDTTGCRLASPKPYIEPLFEPKPQPRDARAGPLEGFEDFWQRYPRKTAKGTARKAWPRAVREAGGPEVIIEAAARFAADPNRVDSFTPHASTWLNAERWADPPLPPRGGPKAANVRVVDQERQAPSGRVRL